MGWFSATRWEQHTQSTAFPMSPALHWRHDCDFLAGMRDVIAINKFKARAD
jgi:hypothetical protein